VTRTPATAPAPAPSVHPQEIPVDQQDRSPGTAIPSWVAPLPDTFRHSGWKNTRARVYAAMATSTLPVGHTRRFRECGSVAWVMQHKQDPTRYRVVSGSCRSRWCRPCQATRAATIRRALEAHWDKQPTRLLTLTKRSTPADSLDELVDDLYSAFRRLRATTLWRRCVTGGVAFTEVTRGDGTHWHVHVHVICQGKYLPHDQLAKAWLAATGDSHVVDIRLVREKRDLLNYVVKYTCKHTQHELSHDLSHLVEAMSALHHRRTVIALGTWRRYRLLSDDVDSEWHLLGPLDYFEHRALEGSTWHQTICDAAKYISDPETGEFTVRDDSS
jgi:hypothetical protein